LVLAGAVIFSPAEPGAVDSPVAPQPDFVQTEQAHSQTALRRKVFEEHVLPILEDEGRLSHQSVERCLKRIEDRFHAYRQGIPSFTKDIVSTWTRLGILRRMPTDWWRSENSVDQYVREKFEKHLFREDQLNEDITAALLAFREDMEADRNRLLSRVKVAISASELPLMSVPDFQEYESEVRDALVAMVQDQASDSVHAGVVALVTSEVASTIAMSLVTRLVAGIGTSTALSAGAAGGATAGGAATGAGTGSLGGPAGTIIGLGVGIVVGVSIDWWMTRQFQSKLQSEMIDYIVRLESRLIHGSPQKPGLKSTLENILQELIQAQQRVLRCKLVPEPLAFRGIGTARC
jgi:hypothetical protein